MKRLGSRGRQWGRRGVCRGGEGQKGQGGVCRHGGAERWGGMCVRGARRLGVGCVQRRQAEMPRLGGRRGAGPLEKLQGGPEAGPQRVKGAW